LTRIIGPPEIGGEAWDAVVIAMINGKRNGSAMDEREHAMTRMAVAWVGTGGEKGEAVDAVQDLTEAVAANAFIDVIMEAWTDPKYVKFALYSQQFRAYCYRVMRYTLNRTDLTHLLILALSLLPPYHSHLVSLSHRPRFLHALQSYLAHPDASIRRLGMLVAETVSEMTIPDEPESSLAGKGDEIEELKAGLEIDEETGETRARKPRSGGARRLRFGKEIWDGAGQGRDEARWLRSSVGVRDGEAVLEDDPEGKVWLLGWDEVVSAERLPESNPASGPSVRRGRTSSPKSQLPAKPKTQPKIVMLTDEQMDDPLEGYTNPSPSSSRSPSPTPSHLEEIASDPSLALDGAQKKKVTRPVYVGQLAALLKERDSPEHLEMALKWGESLVRAKRNFGTELGE
jgi:telomere length regulation protein